jgi:hypothetical protein
MAEAEDDQRLDFIVYILEKRVPKDKVECEKIIRRSANYAVIGTELYRRSEGLQLLQEVHGGNVATTQLSWGSETTLHKQ